MRRSTRRALVSVFLGFWIGLGLLHAKNGRTIPVRVSENAGDHFTYYAIGQDGRIRIDNPKLTEKLQALGNVATGTKIVFLIDDEVPLAEMNVISMLVDKYDLAGVRYFVCNHRAGQMVELNRNDEGNFAWTNHRLEITDHPPE